MREVTKKVITMLTNDREKRICAKYSAKDNEGHVHCSECPLVKGDLMCKAIAYYDRKAKGWVYEFERIEKGVE